MRKKLALFCLMSAVSLSATTAMAENIKGKLGVTGRVGFIVPADSDIGPFKLETDAGFIGGGGFIYGIDRNIAAELDITHSSFGTETPAGAVVKGDFDVINIGLGAQYRFDVTQANLTPYAGAGLDIIISDFERDNSNERFDVDTTVGLHVKGGVDYFLTRQVALNAEGKFVVAPETDINGSNGNDGNFDPTAFIGTAGVRFFFN